MRLLRGWFAIPLWQRVLGALALGLLFAALWPQATPAVQFMGDLFVRAIRMLVVPIVLVTIASGITTLGDPKRIGGLGARTNRSPMNCTAGVACGHSAANRSPSRSAPSTRCHRGIANQPRSSLMGRSLPMVCGQAPARRPRQSACHSPPPRLH